MQVAAIVLAALTCGSPACAQQSDSIAGRQRAVEQGLLPAVVVAGDPDPAGAIHERMKHYRVPGVSIAVINDGAVEWAKGYGVRRAGSVDPVVDSTIFQAGSLSKPVAATALLRLVEAGRLSLDGDVNGQLRSWRVPGNKFTAEHSVTLGEILSHSAGFTVSGFTGYAAGETVPTAVGVLKGQGNTEPVRVDMVPGTGFRYSGGGYTVAQVLLQDVTGERFEAAMQWLVLEPLGMVRSTFVQPLPMRLAKDAANAHGADGRRVKGRWHTYPEQAAAGLWTTPTDLARFALGIRAAYLGEQGAILEQATARKMLSGKSGGYGLGVHVEGTGDSLRFSHSGANAGYRAFFVLYPETGDGVVVMTNSDNGDALGMEVVRAVARAYGWPDP